MTNNMYEFTSGDEGTTWNPLGGACSHACSYCYVEDMKRFPGTKAKYSGAPTYVKNYAPLMKLRNAWQRRCAQVEGSEDALEVRRNRPMVFVCSMNDLFAPTVPDSEIEKVMADIDKYPEFDYLLQTKNPWRLYDWLMTSVSPMFLDHIVAGTTIETNRVPIRMDGHCGIITNYGWQTRAPHPKRRAEAIRAIGDAWPTVRTMVTIEPIMAFDHAELLYLLHYADASWYNIGADSKNKGLPEPCREDVEWLIAALKGRDLEVRLKSNLGRILG